MLGFIPNGGWLYLTGAVSRPQTWGWEAESPSLYLLLCPECCPRPSSPRLVKDFYPNPHCGLNLLPQVCCSLVLEGGFQEVIHLHTHLTPVHRHTVAFACLEDMGSTSSFVLGQGGYSWGSRPHLWSHCLNKGSVYTCKPDYTSSNSSCFSY